MKAWDTFLRRNVERKDQSLIALMSKGFAEVADEFKRLVDFENVDPIDLPSCSIALLRFNGHFCEYFVLGDCSIVVAPNQAASTVVTDRRVSVFDQAVVNEMTVYLKDSNYNYQDALQAVFPSLQANRRKKNKQDGYWILEFDPAALTHAILGQVPVDSAGATLLMTDGFAQAWDTFRLEDSPKTLLKRVQRTGLRSVYAELLAAVERDPNCRHFPRLKPLDDAAAVLVAFEF
ncbi:MAG: hypothetical protein ACLPYZ_10975 [Limisphaerales bacterium]